MSEHWEESLYPIIKKVLENGTGDDQLSEDDINLLNNEICQKFDKIYIITKRN